MRGHSIALVAANKAFSSTLRKFVERTTGNPVLVCEPQSIDGYLGPEHEGALLLAVTSPEEWERARFVIHEIKIQQLPPVLVVVEDEQMSVQDLFTPYSEHCADLFRWNHDSDALASCLKEVAEGRTGVLDEKESMIHDIIEQRLVRFTPSLLPLVEQIALTAMHDVTVLLTGETGTGKTHLARLLHDCSPRKHEPFLSVPCGAQPANLIESAFFGHMRGAFTGADRNKEGKFAAAGNGTILLDEIDTLPLETQASLLKVIETGEYEPLGSNESRQSEARVIVASNWDLEEATRDGRFRQDLYYRLNVMSFHLPPLRERIEDIEPLVRGMVAKFNTRFKKSLFDVSPEAMEILESFDWPGNIRQLENVVQQGVLLSSGHELLEKHLPPLIREKKENAPATMRASAGSLAESRESSEKSAILDALKKNNYSRSKAAKTLGISRVTLYKKMKKYELDDVPLRPSS